MPAQDAVAKSRGEVMWVTRPAVLLVQAFVSFVKK
jgi:hypothetical protein